MIFFWRMTSVQSKISRYFYLLVDKDIFLLSAVSILFFILPFNRGVFIALYLAGLLGILKLHSIWENNQITLLSLLWIPSLFFIYICVTPGMVFKDINIGINMLVAFVVGVSSAIFIREKIWYVGCGILFSLIFSLIIFAIRGFPEDMVWNGRICLFFDHPSVLSFISGLVFLFFLNGIEKQNLMRKKIAIIGCIVSFTIMVFCAARGTFLAITISSIFLGIMVYRRHWIRLILVSIVGVVLLLGLLPTDERERILSAVQNPLQDATFISRQPIWDAAIAGFKESPLIGNGIRTFESFHDRFISEHAEELHNKYPIVETSIASPHNLYLGVAFGYGAIGIVLLLATFLPAIKWAIMNKQYCFPTLLIFYAGYGLFDYPLHRKDGILMLFFPLGFIYGQRLITKLQRQSPAGHKQPCGAQAQ